MSVLTSVLPNDCEKTEDSNESRGCANGVFEEKLSATISKRITPTRYRRRADPRSRLHENEDETGWRRGRATGIEMWSGAVPAKRWTRELLKAARIRESRLATARLTGLDSVGATERTWERLSSPNRAQVSINCKPSRRPAIRRSELSAKLGRERFRVSTASRAFSLLPDSTDAHLRQGRSGSLPSPHVTTHVYSPGWREWTAETTWENVRRDPDRFSPSEMGKRVRRMSEDLKVQKWVWNNLIVLCANLPT